MSRKFKVWCPERGESVDDAQEIAASYPQDAVGKWANDSDNDSGEYRIARGLELRVTVLDPDGKQSEWFVNGEYEPIYYARPIRVAPAA